jgi:hypothetical protein
MEGVEARRGNTRHEECLKRPKKRKAKLTGVASDEGGASAVVDEAAAAELGLTLADDVGLDPPTVPEGWPSILT